jgi:hypothetical protein
MKEKIIELLLALGKTEDEVATNLMADGIKGHPREPCSCPITKYLAKNIELAAGDEVVVTSSMIYYSVIYYNKTGIRYKGNKDLIAIERFIEKFDDWKYPELIEAE